jgi:hypothetical protein
MTLAMHNREKNWRPADGRVVKIMDMELGHLVNVVNWILDNPLSYPQHVLELMVAEAHYRQTVLFAEGQAYPQKIGDRWKIIDPQTGKGHVEKPPAEYIDAVKDNDGYQKMAKRIRNKRKHES